jgi:hypothetical protein
VGLERIDAVHAKLCSAFCVRSHLVNAAKTRPLARVVRVEADRVTVRLSLEDPEVSGDQPHRH